MTPSPSLDQLSRTVGWLKLYAVASAVVIVFLAVVSVRSWGPPRFDVVDVRRINVLNESGYPALALAGQGRLPGPTFEGREYPAELSGGRLTGSGMIFFNERGDEVGGLTFHGQTDSAGYDASAGLMFDQFRQDQVVGLQYGDNGVSRRAGLNVWDRSTEVSLPELMPLLERRAAASGAQRDSLDRELQAIATRGDGLGAHRVFLGSQNRTAMLRLEDTRGRARIRMYVDSTDTARLEFLDADGKVVRSVPN